MSDSKKEKAIKEASETASKMDVNANEDMKLGQAKKAYEKASGEKENKAFKGIFDDLMALIRFVIAYYKGEYRDVSLKTIAIAFAAVLYFLMPFDVIPDFIPIVGYLDDAAVVAWAIGEIKVELDKFKAWESSK